MSRTRVAGIAAAMLAVGLVVGMAGTAIAHDRSTAADCARVLADHMSGQAMGDMSSMMDPGALGPSWTGPGASGMPGNLHQLHHPKAAPGTTP